jgi:hypothetical protein
VAELVVASKSKLKRNTKSLDRHDGNGADGGADGKINESVSPSIDRGNLVNHEDGESNNGERVEKET